MNEPDKDDEAKRREREDAGDRIAREVEETNRMVRDMLNLRSEMGQGPEIVGHSTWPPMPPGYDMGYSSEHGPVAVPPEGRGVDPEEEIAKAKKERLAAELEARIRESEERERAERMTAPTERDIPAREQDAPVREPEPPRRDAPEMQLRYDSQERRQAIDAALARQGVESREREVRQLLELGQGMPAEVIPQRRAEEEQRQRDIALRIEREAKAKDLRDKGKAVEKQMRDQQRGQSRGDDLGK